jgi:hypothetical protein
MKRQRPSSFQQPSPAHRGYDPSYTGYDAAASTAHRGYDPPYTGYDAAASTPHRGYDSPFTGYDAAPSTTPSSSLYDNQV